MRGTLLGAILIAGALVVAPAMGQETKDGFPKSIRLLISSKEGGGYTLYGRLVERHMPRFLPGEPNFVLQSMFGAGGVRLANYMYNVAPRDGSVLGLIGSTTTIAPINGGADVKFDAREFGWIGNLNNAAGFCLSWASSPVKTWQDMMDREFLVAATGANSRGATWPAMLNKLFGTKMKVISGYGGGNEVLLAMERGEIHGRCGTMLAGIRVTRPDWLEQHKLAAPITIARKRQKDFPDSPSIAEFSADKDERSRDVLEVIFKILEIDRPFMATPGLSAERLASLRQGFERMMKDPTFVGEGKTQNLELVFGDGEHVAQAVNWLYTMPREILQDAGGED